MKTPEFMASRPFAGRTARKQLMPSMWSPISTALDVLRRSDCSAVRLLTAGGNVENLSKSRCRRLLCHMRAQRWKSAGAIFPPARENWLPYIMHRDRCDAGRQQQYHQAPLTMLLHMLTVTRLTFQRGQAGAAQSRLVHAQSVRPLLAKHAAHVQNKQACMTGDAHCSAFAHRTNLPRCTDFKNHRLQ